MRDFKSYSFSSSRVISCSKYLANQTYWKLYFIENVIRVIINSVLSAHPLASGGDWWDKFAGSRAIQSARRNSKKYLTEEAKFFSKPGTHPIYFIDFKDLNEIIRGNINLFSPIWGEKSLNKLIVKIEDVIFPRNLIAHMNFPSKVDINRIDTLFNDIQIYLELAVKKEIDLKIP